MPAIGSHRDHSCIACGYSPLRVLYRVSDKNQYVRGVWVVLVCDQCGLGVLDPFPSLDQINSFYQKDFYTEDGYRFRPWIERLRKVLARHRGYCLNRLKPQRGRMMDFGSGTGYFARAQREMGWDVVALDPFSGASDDVRCIVDHESFRVELPDQSFDTITLWYVFEHLASPPKVLAELFRLLTPGGILLLAQQDFGSIQARLFGPRWLMLDPPRHLWQFTEASLKLLAHQSGFELVKVQHASIEMGPFTILQSTLNVLLGNENFLFRFIKNRRLAKRSGGKMAAIPTFISIALTPLLAPLVLMAYFCLLVIGSGDIITVYLRRK